MPNYMSPTAALRALDLAREVHTGKRPLPPEIIHIGHQIEQETRRAELFVLRFGVVDEGMVNRVVALKLQKDHLYAQWVQRES